MHSAGILFPTLTHKPGISLLSYPDKPDFSAVGGGLHDAESAEPATETCR